MNHCVRTVHQLMPCLQDRDRVPAEQGAGEPPGDCLLAMLPPGSRGTTVSKLCYQPRPKSWGLVCLLSVCLFLIFCTSCFNIIFHDENMCYSFNGCKQHAATTNVNMTRAPPSSPKITLKVIRTILLSLRQCLP